MFTFFEPIVLIYSDVGTLKAYASDAYFLR